MITPGLKTISFVAAIAVLAIFFFFICQYFVYSPLILDGDPNFLKFRSENHTNVINYIRQKELSKTQREILNSHGNDVIDVIIMHFWNRSDEIFQNATFLYPQSINSYQNRFKEMARKFFIDLNTNFLIFDNATSLNLSNFHLLRIPVKALNFFSNLQMLNLSRTMLSENIVKLKSLPNLMELNLASNGIFKIPDFSEFPQLKKVVLDSNPIVPLDFSEYKNLVGSYKTAGIQHLSLKNIPNCRLEYFREIFPYLKELN